MGEGQNIPEDVNGEAENVSGEWSIVNKETTPNEQEPTTINYQPSTEMEVHHHPDLHHKTKKWKEYLLEFVMIFLAVTMGFFAESYREHLSDQAKEKEYIESLVADLKSDQQSLLQHIIQVNAGISMMDSMITLLDTPQQIAGNTGQLYYLARLAPRLRPLSSNNRTFEQLKNSGNFRLIKNLTTSNKIMSYYEKFPLLQLLSSINETEFTEYKKVAAKVFDPGVLLKMEGNNDDINRISYNPPLRSTDNELLQELSVYAVYMHGTKKGTLTADKELKNAGAELLDYLQKQYHLQ